MRVCVPCLHFVGRDCDGLNAVEVNHIQERFTEG